VLSDLSSLVSLAQERALDLRPVILRVQTDLFATAPVRDDATIAAFEALACGLLPTVDGETAAIVARKLAPLSDTPENVLRLLASHSEDACCAVIAGACSLSGAILESAAAGPREIAVAFASRSDIDRDQLSLLIEQGEEAIDVTLVRNRSVSLHGAALESLIVRGRTRPVLAEALLQHTGLSAADRAPLYLHADEGQRQEIREGVEGLAVLRHANLRSRSDSRERLLEAASRQDASAFGAELARALDLQQTPDWRFEDPRRHDLLPFALCAADVLEEDGVRILLTLHPVIARSAQTVFHLVKLMRTTPRPSALYLLEAILGISAEAEAEGRHIPALHPSGTSSATAAARQTPDRRSAADRTRRSA
jgi:hypothetical protein